HIASAMYLHPVKEVVYANEEVRKELRLSPDDFVMVMRYASGVTLSQWRKQFPNGIVPVDKAIDFCKQVASALDYAHSEKIIHRDIKPSNIMVETREGTPIARVLDFGLAAEIRSSMSRVSTEKGDTSGTRPYMAPEQWQGKKQGAATDQYALACMFYELVSGAVPFAGVFETGDFNLMMYSVENRSPDSLDELSEEQNAAFQRALSKNPNDRFASCVEFISALQGEVNVSPQNKQAPAKQPSAKTVVCKKCGSENNKISLYCENCGNKIERDDICLNCGAEIGPSQKFCNKCGAKTPLYIAEEKVEAERIAREKAEAERKVREEAELVERIAHEQVESILKKWNMVQIPDSAVHKGLYFGKYEVTQAQWQAIMGDNPSYFTGDSSRPVENISWNDCQEFIKKLNSRAEVKQAGLTFFLPTEEQWEYASRVGSTGKYGLLADGREGTLDEMGWYVGNSYAKGWLLGLIGIGNQTRPVGQKKPNAWGLYDMHGNVCEWTASADGSDRIYRGGSYCDFASICESGYRDWLNPECRRNYLGFRLAASRIVY
ncbi:MAG: SUMF1/EgtB/PvdO family nonheme iron enzyme, partial [Kiritimatiellae bacterium]|nr:SUMF1/EgtB/PvdO family nonheme iron enzyme [Kiritimatiellia bacterium]